MSIPELTKFQADVIRLIANSIYSRSIFLMPDSTKDDPTQFGGFFETQKALTYLESLGLIKDVTADSEDLKEALANTGRDFKMVSITNEGNLLFNELLSDSLAKAN